MYPALVVVVMIPGAGGAGWYWHLVQTELTARGHEAIAVDLPMGAESLSDYARAVVDTSQGQQKIVLVAQSMGGFTAAAVAESLPVVGIAFLNAMIPAPGETPGAWWDNVGQADAMRANDIASGRDPDAGFDPNTYFFHDLPNDLTPEIGQHGGQDSAAFFQSRCEFSGWPSVPIRVLAGRDDRFFPLHMQRAIAAERVGQPVQEVPGGHLAALSHPHEVAQALEQFLHATSSGE